MCTACRPQSTALMVFRMTFSIIMQFRVMLHMNCTSVQVYLFQCVNKIEIWAFQRPKTETHQIMEHLTLTTHSVVVVVLPLSQKHSDFHRNKNPFQSNCERRIYMDNSKQLNVRSHSHVSCKTQINYLYSIIGTHSMVSLHLNAAIFIRKLHTWDERV